jgi:hypothetical protein
VYRFAPTFGSGTKSSIRRLETGLIRFAGIVLSGNGCPVSGSRIAVAPKLPARWAAVGTETVWVIPRSLRKPS